METTLYLVRHGRVLYNGLPIFYDKPWAELTVEGIKDAEKAGKTLHGILGNSHIVTSPWTRAADTCKYAIMSAGYDYGKMSVRYDNRLRERSFKKLEGVFFEKTDDPKATVLSPEDYKAIWNYYSQRSMELGIETLPELRLRVESFLEDIRKEFKGESIVVFGHGGLFRMFDALLNRWPEDGRFDTIPFLRNGEVVKYAA